MSSVIAVVLGFELCFDNPTLPSIAAMTTAVDKSPAYARLSAVATAGDLPTAPTPPPGTQPPLQMECHEGEWWYVCGTPRTSQALGQRDKHFHRRFNSMEAERFMDAKHVNTTMGPHKNLRKPHFVSLCESVSWQALGDAAEIRRLLQSVHAIGSGWSRGLGRVASWEVAEGPWAYPFERPVPVGASNGVGPILHHSIRPPSHLASNRVRCVMPPVRADFLEAA